MCHGATSALRERDIPTTIQMCTCTTVKCNICILGGLLNIQEEIINKNNKVHACVK